MIAGLKDRFVSKVMSGKKRHTIRGGSRWRSGMRIDLFTNVRQKTMKLIFRAPVTKVESIIIQIRGGMTIAINGVMLGDDEVEGIAQRDGFDNAVEMYRFWRLHHYPKNFSGWWTFTGQIIHWDFKKRTFDAPGSVSRAGTGRGLRTGSKNTSRGRRKP